MEKVKITVDQERALKNAWQEKGKANLINTHSASRYDGAWKPLNDLSTNDIARALYIGYEVEPDIKVGDFVDIGLFGINKVAEVTGVKGDLIAINGSDKYNEFKINRILTDKEKQEEKTRRWWAKHDRDVLEIKQGDIIMREGRDIFEVTADPKSHQYSCYTGDDSFDFSIEDFSDNNWKVVCFADDRKDIARPKVPELQEAPEF